MENRIILIDTNIIIDHFRTKKKADTLFVKTLANFSVKVSAISEFELYEGACTNRHHQDLQNIFNIVEILPFEKGCGKIAVEIKKSLASKKKNIEIRDLFIAATALFNQLPLLTLNTKHFNMINDLELLNPANLHYSPQN